MRGPCGPPVLLLACALAAVHHLASGVEFTEHKDQYCQQKAGHEGVDCGKIRSDPFPNDCWSYWSNTDTMEQCKQACIKLKCGCFGYKADDTGYFHKCRIVAGDMWNGKTTHSSTRFVAVTTCGAFPLLTDPDDGWIGWALLGIIWLYLVLGSAYGAVVNKRRGLQMMPHLEQWTALIALARDGAAYSRGLVLGQRKSAGVRGDGLHAAGLHSAFVADKGGTSRHKKGRKQRGGTGGGNAGSKKHNKKGKRGDRDPRDGDRSLATDGHDVERAPSSSPSPAPVVQQTPKAPREWVPTRTGYLSGGARETGVKVEM